MERMDYIQQAKELTGSNDIEIIIAAAKKIEGYLGSDNSPKWIPNNPADFLEYTKIIHPIRGIIPFQPYSFQRDIARSMFYYFLNSEQKPFVHVYARQMGNTTLLSAISLWFAMSSRKQKVVFLGTTMAQCHEVFSRMSTMLDSLPYTFGTMNVKMSRTRIEFYNGSEIVFGSFGSSKSSEEFEDADLIILMDAAWLSYSYDARYRKAIEDALDEGAKVVLSSCSNTNKGLFYEMVQDAESPNLLITKWNQHPDRDEEWAKPYRVNLGARRFLQEFECEFISEIK